MEVGNKNREAPGGTIMASDAIEDRGERTHHSLENRTNIQGPYDEKEQNINITFRKMKNRVSNKTKYHCQHRDIGSQGVKIGQSITVIITTLVETESENRINYYC